MKRKQLALSLSILIGSLYILYSSSNKDKAQNLHTHSFDSQNTEISGVSKVGTNVIPSSNLNKILDSTPKKSKSSSIHRYQQSFPDVGLISNEKLRESIQSLGNQEEHLFAAFLLVQKKEKARYLKLLHKHHADRELFLEAYLSSHKDIKTRTLEQFLERFPHNINLSLRYIKNLIAENRVDDTVSKILELDTHKSKHIAESVYKSMQEIFKKVGLSSESSEREAGLALLEHSYTSRTIDVDIALANAINPLNIFAPEGEDIPNFSKLLQKKYDKTTRSKLIEKYAEYAKNSGRLIERDLANTLQMDKYQMEMGKEPKDDHPLKKESICLSNLRKLQKSLLHLPQKKLLNYLKTTAYLGEYRAMLLQPKVAKLTKGVCSNYLE